MRYRTIKYHPAFLKGVETLSVVFFKYLAGFLKMFAPISLLLLDIFSAKNY